MTKVCTKCGRELLVTTEFFKRPRKDKDWFTSKCRECLNKEKRIWNKENKKHIQAYEQENAERIKRYRKEYKKKNAEHIKESNGKYRHENAERLLKYRQDNKAHRKEYNAQYYQNNATKVKEHSKLYRTRYADKYKKYYIKWKLENPSKISVIMHRRNAKKSELQSDYTVEQWQTTVHYFNNKCAYCGKEEKLTQDHFLALSKGGEYTINNIIPVCLSCNSSKNNKDFFEWYPQYEHYSKRREQKILKYLNYSKEGIQQLAIII
jgi:hypothetical protein